MSDETKLTPEVWKKFCDNVSSMDGPREPVFIFHPKDPRLQWLKDMGVKPYGK